MYTISNFAPETVITLENVKEVLADMGVEYTPKKINMGTSMPSIYKDGKAYEAKFACNYLRKGLPRISRTRMFLEGKTIQEVLDFLNEVKPEAVSADNIIKRPGLQASMHITITDEGPKPVWEGYRPTSMEGMYSLDPKKAEIINRILRGPKKKGRKARKGIERIGDNRKPTYDITADNLSETVSHFSKSGTPAYSKEVVAITKSCEYQTPVVAPGEPYDGHQFQWAAEMPMEKLEEILATIKGSNCKTYADYKKKMAKAEAKSLAKDFTQAINTVNDNLSDSVALEILAQLKKLNAGMEKLTAMWE